MPTIGSITKTVRIAPRDLEIINGLMEDGTSWSGAIHKLCERKSTTKLGEYAELFGSTEGELVDLIVKAFEDGDILYDGKRLYMEQKPRS